MFRIQEKVSHVITDSGASVKKAFVTLTMMNLGTTM